MFEEDLGGAEPRSRRAESLTSSIRPRRPVSRVCVRCSRTFHANNLDAAAPLAVSGTEDRPCLEIAKILPDSPAKPYDMRTLIADVVDRGEFIEVQKDYAKNIVVGFARLGGMSVGVVGNQPAPRRLS